jgi:hypothetical protein
MQTFYAIIKIAPNTMTDDSLSIGLLVCNGSKYWLQFSEEKKNASKRLMDENADAVDFIVKQISSHIQKLNKEITKSNTELFPLNALLNSEYFSYLNNYSNGLLRFSKPSFLNDVINEEKFLKLFALLIDKNIEREPKVKDTANEKFYAAINKNLIKKVEKKIHTKVNINSATLPSMYFQYEMDCIGLNGAFVGAKSIPFNKSVPTLDKEISHYIALISLLSTKYNKDVKKNNFFLIADEPTVINSPEHNTWENILNNPLFKVVNSEEVSIIAEKVEHTKAKTFLVVSAQ